MTDTADPAEVTRPAPQLAGPPTSPRTPAASGMEQEIEEPARPAVGYADTKQAYLTRLRRIEGQVRGIARMVGEDVYCIDILTQIAAVTKALQAVGVGLVGDHLGHCVVNAARSSEAEGAAKVREATEAIARLVRS